MTLYEFIGDRLKSFPRVFDFAKRLRRLLGVRQDKLYLALNAYASNRPGDITFIQIGANDGLHNDPVREFALSGRWSGLMVEPLPGAFRRLILNYSYRKDLRVSFINCAVSDGSGRPLELFTFEDAFLASLPIRRQLSLQRKASVSRDHLMHFVKPGEASFIVKKVVPTLSFADLLTQLPAANDLNVVVIDVEGHERSIIMSMDFARDRPDLIVYEAIHADAGAEDIMRFLIAAGYVIIECGTDNIAVRKQWAELVSRAVA